MTETETLAAFAQQLQSSDPETGEGFLEELTEGMLEASVDSWHEQPDNFTLGTVIFGIAANLAAMAIIHASDPEAAQNKFLEMFQMAKQCQAEDLNTTSN